MGEYDQKWTQLGKKRDTIEEKKRYMKEIQKRPHEVKSWVVKGLIECKNGLLQKAQ